MKMFKEILIYTVLIFLGCIILGSLAVGIFYLLEQINNNILRIFVILLLLSFLFSTLLILLYDLYDIRHSTEDERNRVMKELQNYINKFKSKFRDEKTY